MTDRVKIDWQDAEVGDLIEVEYPPIEGSDDLTINRGVVTAIKTDGLRTRDFYFVDIHMNGCTFYRLSKPVPDEPKNLGAIVQLTGPDGSRSLIVRNHDARWIDDDLDHMLWDGWMYYANNRAIVKHEGWVRDE
jgi:hypothetical protein